MADDTMTPRDEGTPRAPDAAPVTLSDDELEARFHAWASSREVEPEPDPEPAPDPAEVEARRRERAAFRLLILVVVTAVAAWAMVASWTHARYALGSPDAPLDLGDLRQRFASERALDVPSNTWVRFRGAIMTLEATSKNGAYSYFYSPLYRLVVQTKRELPVKNQVLSVTIPGHLMEFVENRDIFPFDLSARFDGEGRIFHAQDVPAAVRPVLDYYLPRVEAPVQEIYVFFDGDTPGSNWIYVGLYGAGLLAFAAALYGLLRAWRRGR